MRDAVQNVSAMCKNGQNKVKTLRKAIYLTKYNGV